MHRYFNTFRLLGLLFFIAILPSCSSSAAEECSISLDQAGKLMTGLIPNAKVLEVQPSPIPALCEVVLESQGNKGILYINASGKLIVTGSIVDIQSKADLTNKRLVDLNRVDTSAIPLDDAIVMGKAEAQHKVIVFDDPD